MKKIIFLALAASLIAACNQSSTNNKIISQSNEVAANDSAFKPANIQEQMIYNRAMEAVVWGML